MKSKEHFKRRGMELLRKSWNGDQIFLHKFERGAKIHSNI